MKELRYTGDSLKFNKEDVKELIRQLSSKDKQVLKANIIQKVNEWETNIFPYVRSWVIHKLYPDKIKTNMPFHLEILDILNEE